MYIHMCNYKRIPYLIIFFSGPRQPWHDIHCELNGPIAHDVFQNFFERWCRQGTKYGRLDPIDPSRIDIMDAVSHPYHWRCQIFRSITSDSAMFEPEKTKVLNSKKGRLVDRSIGELKIFHKFIVGQKI